MPKIIISLFNATRKSQKASIILFFPYSLYYSDFRILRVDLRCKSIEIYRDVIHISSNSSTIHKWQYKRNPHRSETMGTGVFLSMLILLPSTYVSRSAWKVSEQEGTFNPSCPKYYCNALHSSHSPVWVRVMLFHVDLNHTLFSRSGLYVSSVCICPQLRTRSQPSTLSPT